MSMETNDRCPVCGSTNFGSFDGNEYPEVVEMYYECSDCGATFKGVYLFDRFEDVELPGGFEGIIRAAVHIGNENPDDAPELMLKLVNQCIDIANKQLDGKKMKHVTEIR